MDKNTRDILDGLDFIKERMASRADIAELRLELNAFKTDAEGQFRSLHVELREIDRRLDRLDRQIADLKGLTKEIDELRQRVGAIERHLGVAKRIAA